MLLGTGSEDYYNSAYYFSAGMFAMTATGITWFEFDGNPLNGTPHSGGAGNWSAYRLHDGGDPQVKAEWITSSAY